jgi:hypothetical protein
LALFLGTLSMSEVEGMKLSHHHHHKHHPWFDRQKWHEKNSEEAEKWVGRYGEARRGVVISDADRAAQAKDQEAKYNTPAFKVP